MKKTFMINVLMGCLLLLSACGGGSDSSDSPSVVSNVTVSPTEISVEPLHRSDGPR
jgi:ABC-type glycerol-3-phosphate transport system substrate-binding protein